MPEEALALWLPCEQLEGLLNTIAEARTRFIKRFDIRIIIARIIQVLNCEEKGRSMDELIDHFGEHETRGAIYQVLSTTGVMKRERVARSVAEWLIDVGIPPEIDTPMRAFFMGCT